MRIFYEIENAYQLQSAERQEPIWVELQTTTMYEYILICQFWLFVLTFVP